MFTGADGGRLKKTVGSDVTVTFGDVEIRKFGQGASEEILTDPHPNIRLVNGVASYMHRDQLGSVRAIFNAAGELARVSTYWPFGEFTEHVNDATESFDAHGFIPLSGFEFLKTLPRRRASGMMRMRRCSI